MTGTTKMIALPLDGSKNAMRSLDYLHLIYGTEHDIDIALLYVIPGLPPMFEDEGALKGDTLAKLKQLEKKSMNMAERILKDAKKNLLERGFREERLKTLHRKKQVGIARDLAMWIEALKADTVLMTTRGQSRLEAFVMGEVSGKLLDYCQSAPVWIMEGNVTSNRILIAMDKSENALRAVDHAGFMLAGTDCEVTLFHTMRHLRRYVPREVLEEAPELEALWKSKAGEEIAVYMNKAEEMLLGAGLRDEQVSIKIADGSRSAANDILSEARKNGYGTIVLGRRGLTGVKELFMGSVTKKILQDCAGRALWIVQ